MKKLLPAILLLVSIKGFSQSLILTRAFNEPVAGDIKSLTRFDSSGAIPKATGANMNWNFSAIVQTTAVGSSTFVLPGSVASASAYPGTTLVEDEGNSSYVFYKSASTPTTSFESLGFESSNFSLTFTNSAMGAIWPIGFGYSNTDTYAGNVTQPVTGTLNGTINTVASGTGTLTMPGGAVFNNVLQVKAVNVVTITSGSGFSTITGTISSTEYSYYHATQKFEVLTVSYQKQNLNSIAGPSVTSGASIRVNTAAIVGLKENLISSSDISLYPNPVKDVLNLESSFENKMNSIEIYNQLGQRVYSSNYENKINVSGLVSGLYMIEIKNAGGVARKKFIKE